MAVSYLSASKASSFTHILGLIVGGEGCSDMGHFGFAYWFLIQNVRISGVRSVCGQPRVTALSTHAFFIEVDGKCLGFSECEFVL